MTKTSKKYFINLGSRKITEDNFFGVFRGTTAKTRSLLQSAYSMSKLATVDPVSLGLTNLDRIAELESVAFIEGVQVNSIVARIRRSKLFDEQRRNSDTIFNLMLDTPDVAAPLTKALDESKEVSINKRSESHQQRTNFEIAFRTHPPLQHHGEISPIIRTMFGDLSSLCVGSDKGELTKRFSLNIKKGNKNYPTIIEASCARGVLKHKDLKSLFVLISHTINYLHTYKESLERRKELPKNRTPMYAEVLLETMGLDTRGRESKEALWRSIYRMRATEFDVHSALPFFSDDDKRYFANDQFRIIDSTPSISEEHLNPAEGENPAPSYYEIIWHPVVFDAIFNNKSFFALPTDVFKEPDPIFSLYIYLRGKTIKATKTGKPIYLAPEELYDLNQEDCRLHDFMSSYMMMLTRTDKDLRRELLNALENASSDNIINVNRYLFGFNICIEVSGKKRFRSIIVTFDMADVLRECNVKENPNGTSAPTIPNPLNIKLPTLNTSVANIGEQENQGLRHARNKAKGIIASTELHIERATYTVNLQIAQSKLKLTINYYTSIDMIVKFVGEIQAIYPKDLNPLLTYLLELQKRLKPLGCGDHEFKKDEVVALKVEFSNCGYNYSMDEIMECLGDNKVAREAFSALGPTKEAVNMLALLMQPKIKSHTFVNDEIEDWDN